MSENPYEPPKGVTRTPASIPWGRVSLSGLGVMLLSTAALCGIGDFRGGGVSFKSATLALLLAGLFCTGAIILVGGGIGWLMTATLFRRSPSDSSAPKS